MNEQKKHPAEVRAAELDRPDEYKKPGMVYQVWQDGEITLQKCGDLFGQRNLHCIDPAVRNAPAGLVFPHKSGDNSYAFVANREDAEEIRALVAAEK